jgi:hypothetical protein
MAMVVPLHSPEPVYKLPSVRDISDEEDDQPIPGSALVQKGL